MLYKNTLPGKLAYEQAKLEKQKRKLKMEKEAEDYRARKAKADELIDLFMDCAKAFLTGKAQIWVEPEADGGRIKYISFRRQDG